MARSLVRAAALAATALTVTGCGSTNMLSAAGLTSPVAAQAQNDSDDLGSAGMNLPTDLDGEIRRAQLLRAAGDFEGATKSLSQLMLVAPDDPRVVGEYGKVLAQRGRSQDALAFLKRAIELQSNDWTLYSALGVTYDQLDDRKSAQVAYQHALELKPGDPTVLNNYAVSRMLAGDLGQAQQLLAEAKGTGGDYAKISNNQQMVADMQKAKTGPAAAPDTALAAKKAPASSADVAVNPSSVPQPVTTEALAAPSAKSPAGVTAAVAGNLPPPAPTTATLKGEAVVMQQVPYDPKAGPVKVATQAPRQLATPKPAQKAIARQTTAPAKKVADSSELPKLRSAADTP